MQLTFFAEGRQNRVRFQILSIPCIIQASVFSVLKARCLTPQHAVWVSTSIIREVLTLGSPSDIEKEDYESKFEVVPQPFTAEEREKWLSQLSEVVVSSDAFVSDDNHKSLPNH